MHRLAIGKQLRRVSHKCHLQFDSDDRDCDADGFDGSPVQRCAEQTGASHWTRNGNCPGPYSARTALGAFLPEQTASIRSGTQLDCVCRAADDYFLRRRWRQRSSRSRNARGRGQQRHSFVHPGFGIARRSCVDQRAVTEICCYCRAGEPRAPHFLAVATGRSVWRLGSRISAAAAAANSFHAEICSVSPRSSRYAASGLR